MRFSYYKSSIEKVRAPNKNLSYATASTIIIKCNYINGGEIIINTSKSVADC